MIDLHAKQNEWMADGSFYLPWSALSGLLSSIVLNQSGASEKIGSIAKKITSLNLFELSC